MKKKRRILRSCRSTEKAMELEGNDDTNCNWCCGNCPLPQRLSKKASEVENRMTNRHHRNYSIVEVGQNIDASLGDLRRLVVIQTQMKDHQLTLVWKTCEDWLFITEAKQVCDKIDVLLRNPNRNTKAGWKISLQEQINNLRLEEWILRKEKHVRICLDERPKQTADKCENTIWRDKLKILTKEERLKRYQDRVKQHKQNRTSQNNGRKFYQQIENAQWQTNNRMQKKQNNFRIKYWNAKNTRERSNE